jgi:chromosome segregation ATPase
VEQAQQRADALEGFTAAAEHEFNNAEARYRVLDERVKFADAEADELKKEHDRLQDKLRDAEAELSQVEDIENSVKNSRAALDRVTGAAGRWVDIAGTAVNALKQTATALQDAANKAYGGQKSVLSNAYQIVQSQHDELDKTLGALGTSLGTAKRDVQAVPDVVGLARLQTKVKSLKKDLAAVEDKQKDRHPAVSVADLEKAKAERSQAQLVLQQAPEAEQAAQADLRAKEAQLTDATADRVTVIDELDRIQREEFIAAIEVSDPDATGWATGRAVLKTGIKIPDGYRLHWEAGGAPVVRETPTGERVRIDARTLPTGDTDVVARLERVP